MAQTISNKGALSNALTLPITIVLYLVIFIIFYAIYSSSGLALEKEIIGEGFDNDYEFILRDYMRSYVNIGGEEILVSDLIYNIANGQTDQETITQFQEQSNEILKNVKGSHWRIHVYKGDNFEDAKHSIPIIKIDSIKGNFGGGYREANLQLPFDEDESLDITFWVFQ